MNEFAAQRRRIHGFRAVRGPQTHRRGHLRLCARARRNLRLQGPHSSGHVYFALKDESAKIDGVIWKMTFDRMQLKPEEGMEVDRHRPAHHLSQPLELPDRHRDAGARRCRRADGSARRAQAQAHRRGPVRRSAETTPAVSARGHRRRHLADRRGDPRHPASPCRPLPASRHRLAGQGAGRRIRRTGRCRDPGLQRAFRGRPHPQARPPDRRARRRLAGGPVVVQRGASSSAPSPRA